MKKRRSVFRLLIIVLITTSLGFMSCNSDDSEMNTNGTNTEEMEETDNTGGEETDNENMEETDETGGDSEGDSGGNSGSDAMGMLIEKKGVRLHEHHTNDVSEVGGKSGYNFITHEHIAIFGKAPDYNGLTPQERMQVDMHESYETNEATTMAFNFGFTSGIDAFGDIAGNNTTLYMPAPASFDYDRVTDMSQIASAFDETLAIKRIQPAQINAVYLVKLRGEENYIAMKIIDAVITGRNAIDEVYFDFDYKYVAN